jgi:DHA1 family bicyclomycin/chloramphenicol resistance-like MFS transporter
MGACCAPTLGRAIVRDVFPPIDAVKALAYVSSIMAIAPVLAPSLGGIVVKYYDWSMTFYVLAGFGVIGILLTAFVLEESVPQRQALHPLNIGRNYLQLLRTPQFMGHLLTASFVYSTMFAFLSGASFILIEFFKVPAEYFGLYFMFIVFGYIVGNLFTAKVAHTWSSQKLYALALSLPLLSTSAMILFAFMHWYEPILFVAPVLFCTMACGLILPKAMAESLKPFAHMAATASALIGFIQMAIASIAGWLVGVFLLDSPMPMAVVMFAASVAALLSYLFFLRPLLQKNTQSLLD